MQPGDTIVRRFRIERQIGAGGMGTVYRAKDLETNQPVAVKRLDIRAKNDADRFAREAATLAGLKHPGIVRYVAHGLTEEHEHYIAMEWLEGKTLGDRIHEGRLTIMEGVQLGLKVSAALAEAHDRGVVHRDIKPPNLFLPNGEIGRVKVLDFGVARVSGMGATGPTMTRTGALIGTPGYMAPEQARGAKELDARADIFALGSVLFECLTGQPPFTGPNIMAVLAKILLHEAPRLRELRPDVPAALDDLIARMLAKEPEQRPPTVRDVISALSALTLGEISGGFDVVTPGETDVPTKPPALTTNEQRFLCVVLAGEMEGTAKTLASGGAGVLEDEVSKLVSSLGGAWDPLMDGSMLIHFTDSGAATDLAAQAARCAFELRRLYGDVPVVLATGRGVISARLPFGEVIDRAARTLGKASSEYIRLDNVTAALLESSFDVGADGVGFFLRADRKSEQGGSRTLLGKATPCVGRDRELITLEATFAECISEPVARAVLVTGAPGMGKSRLRAELQRKMAARAHEIMLLQARGEPMLAGAPFALAGQLLKSSAGIHDGEAIETSWGKLEERVARHVASDQRRRVTAFLGELAHVPFAAEYHEALGPARSDAVLMSDSLRAAWEDWLDAELEAQPVVLTLENLQWGDPPSVRFIDAALRRYADRPLLVLALARPDVHLQFPNLWQERSMQELKLGPLTKKACEKLVQVAWPQGAPDAVGKIVDRCDGNPFFLEELLRTVSEGSVDSLPDSVVGMIQARLDALGPEAKRVLRAASIFGDTFWRGGVLALLGGGETTMRISEVLDEMADREVLSRSASSSVPNEMELRFRSSSVREAAYAMLTDHDRTLGHRLAAEWLEPAGKREPLVLARHFDRGGLNDRAAHFYAKAAEQSLAANDLAAVIATVDRGLACTKIGELGGLLHFYRAQAHYWLGEVESTLEHAEKASNLLEQGSAPWYRAIGDLLSAIGRLGRTASLDPWVEKAATAKAKPDAVDARVICLARTSEHLLLLGAHTLSETLFKELETAVARYQGLSPLALARVFRLRARRALHAGDPSAYAAGLAEAVALFESGGDLRNATNERMSTGFGFAELGDFAAAEQCLVEAREAAERMDLNQIVAYADHNLASVLCARGQLDRAQEAAVRAIEAGAAQHDRRLEGITRAYLSAILRLKGELEPAKHEVSQAVTILAQLAAPRANALAELARVELLLGRPAPALDAVEEGMKILRELGGLEEGEAGLRLTYAEALYAAQRPDDAYSAIATARDRLFQRASRITDPTRRVAFLEQIPDHARTLALLADWGIDTAPTLRD